MLPASYRASFAYLLRHPWQLALALLGISLGVAVIVAVDLANASARKAYLLSMDTLTGEATHQIIGGPRGVPEDVYTALRVEGGMRAIAPVVEGTVMYGDTPLTLLGIDLFAERDLRKFTGAATAKGADDPSATSVISELLSSPGTVLAAGSTADALGLARGSVFEVQANGKLRQARLLAEIAGDGGDSQALERLLVVDVATAQEWLGQAGWLTRIDVRIEAGDAGNSLADVEALLPPGTRLLSAAARTRSTLDMSRAFMTNLAAMSLLALLVGIFLIFNSVYFSVLQRRSLFATLRALGLTRGQLLTMIFCEATAIGLFAAAAGIGFGAILGEELLDLVARTINDLYFRVTVTAVSVEPGTFLKGLLAGLFAALAAAALPALEAGSFEPRLAMTHSVLERRARRLLPAATASGIALMVAAAVLILASQTSLVAGLVALFLMILGFALCVPLLVHFAATTAAPLANRIGGTSARMAVAGIAAGLSRTSVAIVALAIAVSAAVGVSIMVDSFRGSVSTWLTQSLQADLYVGAKRGPLDPALVRDIEALGNIEHVSTRREAWLEDATGRTQLRAYELPARAYRGTELIDADPDLAWPAWETGDAVLVSEPYGYQHGIAAGDSLRLPTDSGPGDFKVAATFQSFDVNASSIMMSRATYDRHFDDDAVDSLGLYLAAGADGDEVSQLVENLASGRQEIYLGSNLQLRKLSLAVFDRTFVITDVLYWIALGVAFIGILSAMLALQLERARESATLRALGMTPVQLGTMITAQTGVLGLFSGIAAVPLGILMAWVLIEVINRRAFGWQIDMSVDPGIVAVSLLLAVVTALLAGLYPAWRAGRGEPALAMREE